MKLKKSLTVTLIAISLAQTVSAFAATPTNKDALYQVALLQSLALGHFDGFVTASELKAHGDTGIGTFTGTNGELIMLNGHIYQVLGDGTVREVLSNEPESQIPFGNVTFFETDITKELNALHSFADVTKALDKVVTQYGINNIYMVKITGLFNNVYVRSEYGAKKPYPKLVDLLASQNEFSYNNVEGTVVALYTPTYMSSVNSVGWHMHFISSDRQRGGAPFEARH